jgi:hypothetical protein
MRLSSTLGVGKEPLFRSIEMERNPAARYKVRLSDLMARTQVLMRKHVRAAGMRSIPPSVELTGITVVDIYIGYAEPGIFVNDPRNACPSESQRRAGAIIHGQYSAPTAVNGQVR